MRKSNRPAPRIPEDTVELLAAARGGCRRALDELFRRYLPRIEHVVALRTGRKLREIHELEDLVQEALLRAVRGLGSIESMTGASFFNWLAVCAERAIADAARRGSSRKRGAGRVRPFGNVDSRLSLAMVVPADGKTPSKVLIAREEEERIEAALHRLEPHHREVIILRYFCGMGYDEIADALEVGSAATARKALHRAVRKMRRVLGELRSGTLISPEDRRRGDGSGKGHPARDGP